MEYVSIICAQRVFRDQFVSASYLEQVFRTWEFIQIHSKTELFHVNLLCSNSAESVLVSQIACASDNDK